MARAGSSRAIARVMPVLTDADRAGAAWDEQEQHGVDRDGDAGRMVLISADDSATTHWPCGSIVPELFHTSDANLCPRCHQVV